MKLTRIVALGAVSLGLLAVPATAMASTGGALAGTGKGPVPVKVACPPVHRLLPASSPVPAPVQLTPVAQPVPVSGSVTIICCAPRPGAVAIPVKPGGRPIAWACSVRPLVFDLAAGASVATEVHGPRLSVHELVFYRGGIYIVRSAWSDKFTLQFRGQLFVNRGPAIHDGRALAIHGGGVFIVVRVGKGPCPK
jgi:hypothetical protein